MSSTLSFMPMERPVQQRQASSPGRESLKRTASRAGDFAAQEAALMPIQAKASRALQQPVRAPSAVPHGFALHGFNAGTTRGSGVSDEWRDDPGVALGVSDGDNHTWEAFDGEMAARAEGPRENAAHGRAGGFFGLESDAQASAGIDSKYGGASAHAEVHQRTGVGGSAEGYGDASFEGLLRDGKIGAGGSASADATLLGVEGQASAAAGGGPAVGAIDPATGERRHMVSAHGEVGGEVFVGGRAGASGEVYTSGLATGAAGRVEAEAAVRGSGNVGGGAAVDVGGFTVAGAEGEAHGTVEARAGAQAEGEASLSLLRGGFAKGSAGAEAMARASGGASAEYTLLGVSTNGEAKGKAEAGATANASGGVALGNPANMGMHGKAEAFAGARAEGSLKMGGGFLGVDVFSATLSGSVAAGAGVGASGGFMVKDGVLTIDLSLLAAAGFGGSLGGSLTIDFLAPFKMLLRLLEVNGIISSNPEEWIGNILGIVNDPEAWKDRMAGGFDRETTKHADASAGGEAGGRGEASGYVGMNMGHTGGAWGAAGAASTGAVQRKAQPGNARAEAEVRKDLAGAHTLATEAGVDAQRSIGDAMSSVMKGAANPLKMIEAILKGAWTAIKRLVATGLQSVMGLASSVVQSAMRTIGAIGKLIWNFIKALFSGKKPDFAGEYEANKRAMDGVVAHSASAIKGAADQIKTQRVGEASAAIQEGFLALGSAFVAAAGGGLDGATKKSKQAQAMAAKATERPVLHADGSVSRIDKVAVADAAEVGDLVGKLSGAVSSGKDVAATAGGQGATAVKSAEPGLAREGGQAGQEMGKSYAAQTSATDAQVKQKKREGEAEWTKRPGKR